MLKTLILSICFVVHPVHVTLTSIDYVPKSDSFKVFVRMYYDDFLLDYRLSRGEGQSVNLSDNQIFPKNLMWQYINEKINIFVNDRQLNGQLVDLKRVDNEISMDLLYSSGKKPRTITVKNMIMTQLYSDQANMTIIRINDFEEGIKLTSEVTEQTFKLN
ncbi:MAG: hypothetical protein MUO72_08840 [Bacteroidales bacterium]|nr:hypothetical protein [Bacteroidales bacterium]